MTDTTAVTTPGLLTNIPLVIFAKDGDTITTSDARNVLLSGFLIGMVGGGYIGRKRAEAGEEPYAKIFF